MRWELFWSCCGIIFGFMHHNKWFVGRGIGVFGNSLSSTSMPMHVYIFLYTNDLHSCQFNLLFLLNFDLFVHYSTQHTQSMHFFILTACDFLLGLLSAYEGMCFVHPKKILFGCLSVPLGFSANLHFPSSSFTFSAWPPRWSVVSFAKHCLWKQSKHRSDLTVSTVESKRK